MSTLSQQRDTLRQFVQELLIGNQEISAHIVEEERRRKEEEKRRQDVERKLSATPQLKGEIRRLSESVSSARGCWMRQQKGRRGLRRV